MEPESILLDRGAPQLRCAMGTRAIPCRESGDHTLAQGPHKPGSFFHEPGFLILRSPIRKWDAALPAVARFHTLPICSHLANTHTTNTESGTLHGIVTAASDYQRYQRCLDAGQDNKLQIPHNATRTRGWMDSRIATALVALGDLAPV